MRSRAFAAGLGLAVLVGGGLAARAQQAVSPPAPAAGYDAVSGRGWVGYAPASAPAVSPGTAVYSTPAGTSAATPAPGWAGYAPAAAWVGYAPASSVFSPAVRGTTGQVVLPADGSRRRASTLFVDRTGHPELAYTLPSYKEYGSGRPVPLAKPWLPLAP